MDDADENALIRQRRDKLNTIRRAGDAYPNDFRRDGLAADLHQRYGAESGEALEAAGIRVRVAGRMVAQRIMGKASFAQLQDMSGRIQLFLQRDALGADTYQAFKGWDVGDLLGAAGTLFKTRTGELSVRTDDLRLLSKALRPLPEKFHGLTDQEMRYRQRYVDLIVNEPVRRVFYIRSAVIRYIREFLVARGFLEVETPMMQPIPGGAAARPFVTHHNALGRDLYLRVAPELYLKRLLVGGLEQVFELNRCFRNEGVSARHNPEFTMLELYQAYADYRDLMDLTEVLLRDTAVAILGAPALDYQGARYDLSQPFRRMTLRDALTEHVPELAGGALDDPEAVGRALAARGIDVPAGAGWGIRCMALFEKVVEPRLEAPTFVTGYPTEVSPLARRDPADPRLTERFELFIAGREIANGFSELNDPEDQAERFKRQVEAKAAGDEEAMHYDADYIRALEYGMPPAAGQGIGIDRLVMLFTDAASIRDVVLFPHLKPGADTGGVGAKGVES